MVIVSHYRLDLPALELPVWHHTIDALLCLASFAQNGVSEGHAEIYSF